MAFGIGPAAREGRRPDYLTAPGSSAYCKATTRHRPDRLEDLDGQPGNVVGASLHPVARLFVIPVRTPPDTNAGEGKRRRTRLVARSKERYL
ncbi:hypothetical protein Cob_v000765 [Colletotrichum orbiculare MAFF 240422]|uniref:Uncharacterized protein n=1 Tax=Colletotrichum orbiculare (strain 104-T / ATCC 96160 / CBS 514.97 / LARS 414 / MAFF 240422) TaxID=1213857 RepID=A0A484G6M2_COLOR|nr:hypothetical protein Cob_v000765 [Colletotrichum orbiculare MAFF 240422]